MTGYTTEEVARLLGLSPAQIRSYTRAGFLSPARAARGELRFAFQDLVLLRAAKGLMAADLDAEQWFDLGLELEVSAPEDARDAYRRALELDPRHADARVNLGRLLVESGRAEEAETHFRAVLADCPDHATAWYNLGIALEDRRCPNDALKAYEQAIAADRRLADAYFNLARLYEQAGEEAGGPPDPSLYPRLTGGG